MASFRVNFRVVFRMSALLLLFYASGQYLIAFLQAAPPAYSLFTVDNALNVLIVSVVIALVLWFESGEEVEVNCTFDDGSLWFIYLIFIIPTTYLCYAFPWGTYGQELGMWHSVKSYCRHFITVISVLVLIGSPRSLFFLFVMDLLFLFIDPSRVFFVEAIFPKILVVIGRNSDQILGKRLKIGFYAVVAGVFMLYIQSFRLGISGGNFIVFALYSDVVHSTYPALQMSDLSVNFPFSGMQGFSEYYSEKFAPLGGFYMPGQFLVAKSIVFNCFIAVIFTKALLFFYKKVSRLFPVYCLSTTGVFFLIKSFQTENFLKLLVLLFFSFFLVSMLVRLRAVGQASIVYGSGKFG